jgi:type IV pilus assembly protein PilB
MDDVASVRLPPAPETKYRIELRSDGDDAALVEWVNREVMLGDVDNHWWSTRVVQTAHGIVFRGTAYVKPEAVPVSVTVRCPAFTDLPQPTPDSTEFTSPGRRIGRRRRAQSEASALEDIADSVVWDILQEAVAVGATDVYLEPRADEVIVRRRVDGIPEEAIAVRAERLDLAAALRRIAAAESLDVLGSTVHLRASSTPTVHGEQATLKIVPVEAPRRLSELGMPRELESALRDAVQSTYLRPAQAGLVLVVGPRYSGQTSTLRSIIHEIIRPECRIVVVGHRADLGVRGCLVIEPGDDGGPTHADALRTALDDDADVIAVDGIADEATARLAIEGVMGGRLVVATMAAHDAPTAILRLVDMGISPQLLGASLRCVVAQQFARRVCNFCKESYEPDADELTLLGASDPFAAYRHRGCPWCSQSGYSGRVPFFEVLTVQPHLRPAVEFGSLHEIAAAATAHGTRSLREDGYRLVREGITTLDEIRRATAAPLSR